MAGLGRRSHYRKHLTDAVLHDYPEPQENECIAKVVATRGSNQFDVLVASSSRETTPQLAILPSKFNKLIWVKRGDFCIVETGDAKTEDDNDTNGGGGVRYRITHILYKEQIKNLKSKNLWPSGKEFETSGATDNDEEQKWTSGEEDEEDDKDDGIVFDTGVNDEYFVNTNRVNAMQIQDSSESESSGDERDIQKTETDDVIEFDTQDEELFANTNRVAALRMQDSESDDSSNDEGKNLQRQEDGLMRGESIEFDTGNTRGESIEFDTGNTRGESIEFDTGNNRNMSRLTALQMQAEAGDDSGDDNIQQKVTDDGILYDTADVEEVEEPECESDDDEDNAIQQQETDDGLIYDTADADEVDPNANEEVSDDESDDEKLNIAQTETDDALEYDTAKEDKQVSNHDVV